MDISEKISSNNSLKFFRLQNNQLDQFIQLIYIFKEVFEMDDFFEQSKENLQKLLERQDFMAVVAMEDEKVVGGLTIYMLQHYYHEKPLAYIYDLAVHTQWQRKGIGRKLMNETLMICKEYGAEVAFVEAEKEDAHAVDFYRITNPGDEMEVFHFSYDLNSHSNNP